jgi:molybdopterin-guanine dinucleotide biosynthesis protein A
MIQATGVILTGGRSTRMGTDKALLQLDKQTILENSVRKLKPFFPEILIVGGHPDRHAVLGARTVPDIYPDCGPLGGIHAALCHASCDQVFITACDMPFWGLRLAHLLFTSSAGYDGAVPTYGDYYEPLLAVYAKSCLPAIEICLEAQQYKVTRFFASLNINFIDQRVLERVCCLDVDFYNINTAEDLSRIKTSTHQWPLQPDDPH